MTHVVTTAMSHTGLWAALALGAAASVVMAKRRSPEVEQSSHTRAKQQQTSHTKQQTEYEKILRNLTKEYQLDIYGESENKVYKLREDAKQLEKESEAKMKEAKKKREEANKMEKETIELVSKYMGTEASLPTTNATEQSNMTDFDAPIDNGPDETARKTMPNVIRGPNKGLESNMSPDPQPQVTGAPHSIPKPPPPPPPPPR